MKPKIVKLKSGGPPLLVIDSSRAGANSGIVTVAWKLAMVDLVVCSCGCGGRENSMESGAENGYARTDILCSCCDENNCPVHKPVESINVQTA